MKRDSIALASKDKSRFLFRPLFGSLLSSLALAGLQVTLVLIARPAPAKANRPLLRPAQAIRNLRMAMPVAFEEAADKNHLGIDSEDAAVRKAVLAQATTYIDLRRGRLSKDETRKWYEQCETAEKARETSENANPFCRYEEARKSQTPSGGKQTVHLRERQQISADLLGGRYERLAEKGQRELIAGVSQLENMGKLGEVSMKVADTGDCMAASIPMSLAYKLEERFPALEAIELSKRLYKKASKCSNDFAAAQASFRLGLIQIWQQNCDEIPDLMAKVENIPAASQYHARAKYWRYFCAGQKGNDGLRAAAKDALLRDHPMSFQTLAAAGDDDAALAQILKSEPPQVAYRSIINPDLNPMLRAAEALVKLGANNLAAEIIERHVRELGSVEAEVRLYTAVVLNRIGYALPKFKILTELFQDAPKTVNLVTLKLFFPLWYYDLVKSKQGKIDPLLILSLIRQESAFNKEARSIAGARGLMQVMPGTARSVAHIRATKLFDPSTNIGVGTKYFLKRLEQYGGDVELTLAAYNAGFMRVDQWKKRYPTDNKLLFLDFIPFRETREYVSSILRNYFWYVKLYSESERRSIASVEGRKANSAGTKVLAIVSANAGQAAALDVGK